jgi:hypothetical protein
LLLTLWFCRVAAVRTVCGKTRKGNMNIEQIGAVALFAILLVVCVRKRAQRKKREWDRLVEEENEKVRKKFEEEVSILKNAKIAVVVRQKDGKISDFEGQLISLLIWKGAKIPLVPGKTARQIWEQVFYENSCEIRLKEEPHCFLVGTIDETSVGCCWFNFKVITPDFSFTVGTHRLTSKLPEYWKQEFLGETLKNLAKGVRQVVSMQEHFT